ncbi:MAG: hypothetical protein QW474_01150 [Candidatus Aenigmatarchaeota archaeon]
MAYVPETSNMGDMGVIKQRRVILKVYKPDLTTKEGIKKHIDMLKSWINYCQENINKHKGLIKDYEEKIEKYKKEIQELETKV